MKKITKDFITAIPKTDLHLHLDGSLRLSSLIEMSRDRNINLPSFSEEGLKELVFKTNYNNLDEYLTGFAWTGKVLQDREGLERVSYELAQDAFTEGVRYIEIRFAPQLHMSETMSFEDVMSAVYSGLEKAKKDINAAMGDDEPEFEYGIIVCAMRYFDERFSDYYRNFCKVHTYLDQEEIIRLASMELARASVKLRNETGIPLVAFDLAGSEYGYPASAHEESFQYIHSNFINKTVHAGEAYGPESIFQAITKLHANRIGHGLRLFNKDMIQSEDVADKTAYIDNLSNYIAETRTTIEVCLTSNLQTCPDIKEPRDHSLGKMLDKKLSITFCTDNRLVSNTNVCKEISLALDNFDISPGQLKNIIIYGFKRSFFHKPYSEKRSYVRKIINYYEKLEKEYA
jgi:adenosine deaminase